MLNGFLLSASAIVMRSVSVSFNIYVSSKIGQSGMGLLTLIMSVYGFAVTVATSGINLAVVRLVSGEMSYESGDKIGKKTEQRVNKIMKDALLYCLFFSSVATLLLYFGANTCASVFLDDKRAVSSLRLLSLTLIPISISSALNGYFCAVRRIYKNVVAQFFEQGVKIFTVSSLLILLAPKSVELSCLFVSLGGVISETGSLLLSSFLYFFDRKLHRLPKGDFEKNRDVVSKKGFFIAKRERLEVGKIASVAFPLALGSYARSLLLTIEHLAIPWGLKRSGIDATGALSSYGILHGMVFPLLLFPTAVLGAFSSLLVPELSQAQEQNDTSRIKSIVSRVFYFSLLFSLGVSGIFICFSGEIGNALYASSEAGELIRILSPLIPLMYLDGAVDAMLKGLGEQIYTMRVNIIDSFMSILLILTLLPSMGIQGYITAIFLTEIFNTSFSILRLMKVTKINPPVLKWVIKPLINIIAATLISRLVFNSRFFYSFLIKFINGEQLVFFEIGLCVLLYFVFARLSGTVSKTDIVLAKKLIKS